jgi:hypothetical protein
LLLGLDNKLEVAREAIPQPPELAVIVSTDKDVEMDVLVGERGPQTLLPWFFFVFCFSSLV